MTKAQMIAELKAHFDKAYTEWQISESMLREKDEDTFAYECIENCAIREFQECETIARIAKQFFGIELMEIFD